MTELQFREFISKSIDSQYHFQSQWNHYEIDPSLLIERTKIDSILSSLEDRLNDNYPFYHPAYAGQMIKPPHPIAIAAYLMAMQINPNNHALDGGPATAKIEIEVVNQIATMFGYSEHLGHLTSSGTIANLEALWAARSIHPTKSIAFSRNAHYTHKRMCEVLQTSFLLIDYEDLVSLETELQKGNIGTLVVTVGTTGTGAVEPLHHILPLAKKYGVRVHADCAYGGFFMLLAKDENPIIFHEPFLLLKDCDSIVIDPHKHGLQPYGCGCILFKDSAVGKFYKHDSPYTYFTSRNLHLGEISLECSRPGASAAALWATLQAFPLQSNAGLGSILTKTRSAAIKWSGLISSSSLLVELTKPELDIVIYFPRTNPFSASSVSQLSERIFADAMRQTNSPIYVATFAVDSSFIAKLHPAFIPDSPITKVLRSVLMKPEHEQFVPEIFNNISAITESLQ